MGARARRDKRLDDRRELRRAATVEAAVARAVGLNISDQVQLARNAAAYGAGLMGLIAAGVGPFAFQHLDNGWGVLGAGVTLFPTALLARRTWRLQQVLNELRSSDDPTITDGDDEMAHLRELVRSLDDRPAEKVGRSALEAAQQGYAQRRRILERRGHVEALVLDADPHLGPDALAADLDSCDRELVDIDKQLQGLIEALAHLADSADQSRGVTLAKVRDATDAVNALASAFDELPPPPS